MSQRADGAGRRAIIDIGSNTVRLVIFGPPARAPTLLHNEKITARLGKGVAEGGGMGEKAMAQALRALTRYAALLRLHGVADVQTVATAAVRDAANGPDFLAKVAALGLAPRLLSGEEEAMASARGVQAAFPGARGIVGDLGGGSLELVDIDGPLATHGTSLPLGTLRLPALRAAGGVAFAKAVRAMLEAADWQGAEAQDFYLVGGSWRALGRYAMLREQWPIDDPHGFTFTPEVALRLTAGLRDFKPTRADAAADTASPTDNRRASVRRGEKDARASAKAAARALILHPLAAGMQVSAGRLATLPDAAALLEALIEALRPARLVFSAWGLREGLLAAAVAEDPLLAGVTSFAAGMGVTATDARAMAAWTAAVNPADAGDPRSETLRLAATMLALASMSTEPNLRPELAANWALRKRWVGIDAQGRAMLALAVLANSGRTAVPEDLLRLAPPSRLREALVWGLATRLGRRLGGGMAGSQPPATARLGLEQVGGAVVLTLAGDSARLSGEVVEKDLRLLAEGLGLSHKLQVGDLPAG